jgi:hypothetical protein
VTNRISDVIASRCGEHLLGRHIFYIDRVGEVRCARLEFAHLTLVRKDGTLTLAFQLACDAGGAAVKVEWYRDGKAGPWGGWPVEVARFKRSRREKA